MTSRERFVKALRFEEPDRPPHFEMVFNLTQDAFGLDYPSEEEFIRASKIKREKLFAVCAEVYAKTIEKYKWDAVLVWNPAARNEVQYEFIPFLKKYLGSDIPVGSFVWESVISIDIIKDYTEFSVQLTEEPEKIHEWAKILLKEGIIHTQKLIDSGCEIFCIASDFAFNNAPFLSPKQFSEFIKPYLSEIVSYIKRQGGIVILHTDGNLMKILDDILDTAPDILQSIDPMAGMDIRLVKDITYKKIALMGNVQCSLLQDGSYAKIVESAKYCLDHASKGGGYIFSSSNSIFKGLPLKNYEIMLDYYWKRYNVE